MSDFLLSIVEKSFCTNKFEGNMQRETFLTRLKNGLIKTRSKLGHGFIEFFKKRKIDSSFFEELERLLLLADLGVKTTTNIVNNLVQTVSFNERQNADFLYAELRKELSIILEKVNVPLVIQQNEQPFIILIIGVNGVGKTTTIGKLANIYKKTYHKSVMLVAADTYRAAAVEQLKLWGEYCNVPVVTHSNCSDAASIVFDGVKLAKEKLVDILLIDTAGRLQNKSHLMHELQKIVKVLKKMDFNYPHEVMLIIDASTGQNAISQVNLFNDCIKVTGITITKFDGTAKGGVIFAISDQFGIPVRYIGVGEEIEDLQLFDVNNFIKALFDS